MKVLGFSAKARHGKDTCAQIAREIAQEEYGVLMGRFALADPLKARVYGEGRGAYTVEDVFVNKPPALRDLLQQVGTERGRNVFGEDFWVLQAEAFLYVFETSMPFMAAVTIPDIRFPNEVKFAQRHGLSLKVVSNRPTLTGKDAEHSSETALDGFTAYDGVIVNNTDTTFDMLREQLRPFVRKLVG